MRLVAILLTAGLFAGLPTLTLRAQTLNQTFKAKGAPNDISFGEGVLFRRDTLRTNGPAGVVTSYYPSGKKYQELPLANLKKGELQGTQTRWYESGQVQLTAEYAAGQRQGLLLTYYPDGSKRRREEFQQGVSRKSECYTATGQPQACTEYVLFPEYPGGLKTLLSDIGRRVKYPRQQIRKGVAGKVLINFIIDKTGGVKGAYVLKGLAPVLDEEALRVVNSLKGWTPGRLDGEPVDALFTLPVTFAIQ
ncbi:energy transducer TonB [Hymenobacter cellulosilyticus]|uniref:TonB family protein n=1 Tax=Hymenobacter cellulosilyticus TaxID=2932248 RepID=A0A8T9Q5J4_9BACT|nr:energy transducer TonB [Hymenobacter cellulosilyticus]UOQ71040.1 TonB family protein [Hymenobacter cellulosilyticus]